jgi:hypothetical protein
MKTETLMKWKEAGVLFAFSHDGKAWHSPFVLDVIHNHADRGIEYFGRFFGWCKHIRPYRAPGHIQPHDGSSERPEWVNANDLVVAHVAGGIWLDMLTASELLWLMVDYYIVLPSIGGNNEN